MESLWNSEVTLPKRKVLARNRNVQTVVIGAGLTGILTAYFLKKKGQEVIVLEAKKVASGQTSNTTAKITSQHGLIYEKLCKNIGQKKAGLYAHANEEAIEMYAKIIRERNIDCDFERLPALLYTACEENVQVLCKEAETAERLGIASHFVEGELIKELPFMVRGAVCFENQAQFHPLKFIKHLATGLEIYEHTKVLSVKGHVVVTEKGNIVADHIVFAAHYPFMNLPGFYFLREHQERSYVLALEGTTKLSAMYYGVDEDALSLRSAGNDLLLGGGGHRSGKNMMHCTCQEREKLGYSFLRRMARKYYPDTSEKAAWSAQDCMPHDEIPLIGKYSVFRPYWYVATGFKKWGMTTAMIAAVLISDQITGNVNPYEKLYSPQRFLPKAAFKNLLLDIGESIRGLSLGLFAGKERRCPHMGCKLEWNEEEASWDCPCHGSRFDKEGEIIDNPAQINLTDKEEM